MAASSSYGCLQESMDAYKTLDKFAKQSGFGSIKQIFDRISKMTDSGSNNNNNSNNNNKPDNNASTTTAATATATTNSQQGTEGNNSQSNNSSTMTNNAVISDGEEEPQKTNNNTSSSSNNGQNQNRLSVMVTVNEGMSPGETIHVTAPDGSGRVATATIPTGSTIGSSFVVEFPSHSSSSVPASFQQQQSQPVSVQQPYVPPNNNNNNNIKKEEEIKYTPTSSSSSSSIPHQPQSSSSSNQALIQVQVPPGTQPGSTIYVQVPGEENRMIGAIVPPNVTLFHVAYQPNVIVVQEPVIVSGFNASSSSNPTPIQMSVA